MCCRCAARVCVYWLSLSSGMCAASIASAASFSRRAMSRSEVAIRSYSSGVNSRRRPLTRFMLSFCENHAWVRSKYCFANSEMLISPRSSRNVTHTASDLICICHWRRNAGSQTCSKVILFFSILCCNFAPVCHPGAFLKVRLEVHKEVL